MTPKRMILVAGYMILAVQAWSLDITLARLYQYNPEGGSITKTNITHDLYERLRKRDWEGILSLSGTKSKDVPKSILEAGDISNTENINFLLYGFLKASSNSYDMEIKLYDRESAQIQTVFYAKTTISNYKSLVETISGRIISYFYKTLGVIKKQEEKKKEYGVIDIEGELGYWIPFDPWAESLMGFVSVHLSSSLTPVSPLFKWDIFTFALSYGIGMDYSPGMNRKGFESYYLHSVRMGLPVTFSALWYYRNKIILQIAPELQLDILVQDRLYGSMVNEKSAAFSLSVSMGYEYLFTGKRFSVGLSARLHSAFYSDILFSAEPSFYCRYRFNPIEKSGPNNPGGIR